MRDSRSLSFSLSLSLRAFYFKKLSRLRFSKNFLSFFPHTTTKTLQSDFVIWSSPSRRRARENHTHKGNERREKMMDGARVLPFFSFSAARLFLSRLSLSLSLVIFLNISRPLFSLTTTTTKSLFHVRVSQNDRRRGVPRQPARRFRRRRF